MGCQRLEVLPVWSAIIPQSRDESDTFRSHVFGDLIKIESRSYTFFHGLGQIEEQALH